MRPIWSGSISFGLVNIPVKLYSAIDEGGLDFDLIHARDNGRIRYARMCRAEEKEVPWNEIAKGYQYREAEYVVLTDEDFVRANVSKQSAIRIAEFVDERAVESVYYEKPYYLEPEGGADTAYALLRDVMRTAGKVGLGTFVMRQREKLVIIQPRGKGILLEQLRFAQQIRGMDTLHLPAEETEKRARDMALSLLEKMAAPFDPAKYRDTYTDELLEIIAEKAKGVPIVPRGEVPQPTPVANLMEMLKASLEQDRR